METKQDGKQKKILAKFCVVSTLKHEMLILMLSVTYLNKFLFSPFSVFLALEFWIPTYQMQRNVYVVYQNCENRTLPVFSKH